MPDTIEYEEFDAAQAQDASAVTAAGMSAPDVGAPPVAEGRQASASDITRLSEIPMELSVEIGRTRTTVGETLELRVGSVVALGRQAGEPVDLLVNGSPIARGEVVVVDERYGLRITEILDGRQEDSLSAAAGAQGAGGEPGPDAAGDTGA